MSAAKTQQQAKKTSNFFSKILIQKSPPKALRHSAPASLQVRPGLPVLRLFTYNLFTLDICILSFLETEVLNYIYYT